MREYAVAVSDRRVILVQCDGDPDLAAATLRARLAPSERRSADVVIVDVGRVASIDAAALSVLVELGHSCRHRDVGLVLTGLSPFTRRLLAALDPDRVTVVADDMVAATHWAATWTPLRAPDDAARTPTVPPGPRRCAPTGLERPWYEWR